MKNILTCGIDVGSSAVKVAIVRSQDGAKVDVLATTTQRIRRRQLSEIVESAFTETCVSARVEPAQLSYTASTGDGEAITIATGHFYGITTHGRGGAILADGARAVLDMGALHARALKIDERGKVLGHRMTSQCASGTGQFLENIARYLGVPIEDVGALSRSSTQPEEVSSICAVLAETDVINMVSRDIGAADILRGIHLSIAGRLAKLLKAVGAEGTVALTGGLARDEGLVAALTEAVAEKAKAGRTPLTLVAPPLAQVAGAIGAAALAAQRYRQLERRGVLETLRAGAHGADAAH